jgi:hypothetical protein
MNHWMRILGRSQRGLAVSGVLGGLVLVGLAGAQGADPPAWKAPYERAVLAAQKGEAKQAASLILESFQAGLDDPSIPLCDPHFDGIRSERVFRATMRSISRSGPLRIVSKEEPGKELVILCKVLDAKGHAAAAAVVYAFQADAEGRYTREAAMDEPHARIFGYVRADEQGRFEIHTIHPGLYPEREDVEGPARFIPEHVHFEITMWDGSIHNFQLVFANSTRMQHGYWRQWAHDNGNPVASIQKVDGGGELCRFTVQLRP